MSDDMFEKELASIEEYGFVDPVTTRRVPSGRPQIIDGENRWRAAIRLALPEIPIIDLGEVDDQTAQKLTIVLNETRGSPNPQKLGELLKRLAVKESRERLLRVLPYSQQAFEGLTGLPTLSMEPPRLMGKPGQPTGMGWVERTYRMPRDAAEVVDQAIARVRTDDPDMAEWQALEAIAADFLA